MKSSTDYFVQCGHLIRREDLEHVGYIRHDGEDRPIFISHAKRYKDCGCTLCAAPLAKAATPK